MADVDAQLMAIAATPVNSIADVIAAFSAIDAALPESDGLKWFNWLYLTVTKAVDLSIGGGSGTYEWNSPAWLTRLDVVFAGLYLGALARTRVPQRG